MNNDAGKKALEDAFFRSNLDVLFISTEDTGLLLNPSSEKADTKNAVQKFLASSDIKSVISDKSRSQKTSYFNADKLFDFPSVVFIYKYGPSNAIKTGIVGFNASSLCELMGTG